MSSSILRGLVRRISDRRAISKDPSAFARRLGVRVGERVRFYGMDREMFGSEPWLVSIGSDCFVTAGVQFITHDGGTLILRCEVPTLEWTAPIVLEDRVYVGVRSIILPGVTIGSRSIIGAGSVVTRPIPAGSVAAGNPARVIRSTDEYLKNMSSKSLGIGHLRGSEKEIALRRHFGFDADHD